MTRVYIIDDEFQAAELLKVKLSEVTDHFDEIKIFNDSSLAYQKILEDIPDLIFMDIEMPGINGLNLHAEIEHLKIPVIYVTAYSKYSINAIKLHPFDYLLKPVRKSELSETINKYLKDIDASVSTSKNTPADPFPGIAELQRNKITVNTQEGIHIINTNNIAYLEAMNNYTKVLLNDGTSILASKTLKFFEATLREFGFVRVHKSYIVNLEYIDRLTYKDGGHIVMKNGNIVYINKEKKNQLLEIFNRKR